MWILAAVALLSVTAVSVSAFPSLGGLFGVRPPPSQSDPNRQAVQTALQSNDYQGYLSAIEAQWQAYKTTITSSVFAKMVTTHQNRTANMQAMNTTRTAINQAINDGSYTEWQTAIAGLKPQPPYLSKINETNFPTYVQYVKALQAKDFATTKTLATQLGIAGGFRGMQSAPLHPSAMNGHGKGRGFKG